MLNKLKEMRESREEGFTLIELLVVIVIIGVLAAIALPIFLNQQKAAINAGIKSDVRNTVSSVATFLIKKPTATANELQSKMIGITASGTGKANIVPVTSDIGTTIDVSGAWDSYVINGSNANTNGNYIFNSTSGKYTDTLS
jgi:type IV pilus assembly protein PilA